MNEAAPIYAASMAAEAWQGKQWKPGKLAAERRRIRVGRGDSEGGFGFARWALAIGLAVLAIFWATDQYSAAAASNREGVFGAACVVGLVVGGLAWFM